MKINFKKLISSLGIGLLGGFLGAFGGAGGTSKAWRRIGLTLIYTIYALISLRNWWALTIISVFYPLTCGYGIPEHRKGEDKGSAIGRFWYKLFLNRWFPKKPFNLFIRVHRGADYFTRGTIALMILASVIVAPILTEEWANYFIYGLALLATHIFVSWRNLDTFKFLDKDLSWSEMITWGVTTFCITKIIG